MEAWPSIDTLLPNWLECLFDQGNSVDYQFEILAPVLAERGNHNPKVTEKAPVHNHTELSGNMGIKASPGDVQENPSVQASGVNGSPFTPVDNLNGLMHIPGYAKMPGKPVPRSGGNYPEYTLTANEVSSHFIDGPVATHSNNDIGAFLNGFLCQDNRMARIFRKNDPVHVP
jgi:hypothetical protein